jgi:WD40 repeat protein
MTRHGAGTRWMAVAAAIALTVGVAACGDDGDDDATATTAPATTAAETTETTEARSEAEGDPELVWSVTHEGDNVFSVAVHPDGETVLSGHFQAVRTYQAADGELVDVAIVDHSAETLDVSPDGDLVAVGLPLYGVTVIDLDGTEVLRLGEGFDSRAAFSPDGATIVSGNRDGVLRRWGTAEGVLIDELSDPTAATGPTTGWVSAVATQPRSARIVTTDSECVLRLWDPEAREVVGTLELDTGEGSCIGANRPAAFSPDGELLAGPVREDGTAVVRLWTADDLEPVRDLEAPERVRALDFSPDGTMLAVGSRLATTVWDVDAGTLLHTFDQEIDPVADANWPVAVAFTPDGGHVLVGRWDGTVELWRLPGAEELVAPERAACDPVPLPGDVLFDTGSADLRPDADAVLTALAGELAAGFDQATLTFVGHTDSRGSAEANRQLSLDRAGAVRAWFDGWAAAEGVDGWTFEVDGRGDTELKVPDTNLDGDFLPDAGALNRRVDIEIDAPAC